MAPPIVHAVLRSPGQPLEPATRAEFERRFDRDFSRVRVHTGEQAAASAAAVNALAYTAGNHVVFGGGRAAARAGDDGRLLAHELVYVVQWGDQPIPARLRIGPADGPAERHARAGNAAGTTTALQRAVPVCEEYRAEDTGSGTPGPGISVNVSRSGKRADVNARLQVHGAEADAAKASTIQSTISSNWNGSFSDGYSITTRVGATHRPADQAEDGNATQIAIVRSGAGRPSGVTRNWLIGSRRVALNLDYGGDQLGWVIAHEFGHLLGLSDRYSESFWSKAASLFGGDRTNTLEAGYENNIMAVDNGSLDSRNVQDLIARYIDYTCIRWRLESPL